MVDYLEQDPNVDRNRTAVAGFSGFLPHFDSYNVRSSRFSADILDGDKGFEVFGFPPLRESSCEVLYFAGVRNERASGHCCGSPYPCNYD